MNTRNASLIRRPSLWLAATAVVLTASLFALLNARDAASGSTSSPPSFVPFSANLEFRTAGETTGVGHLTYLDRHRWEFEYGDEKGADPTRQTLLDGVLYITHPGGEDPFVSAKTAGGNQVPGPWFRDTDSAEAVGAAVKGSTASLITEVQCREEAWCPDDGDVVFEERWEFDADTGVLLRQAELADGEVTQEVILSNVSYEGLPESLDVLDVDVYRDKLPPAETAVVED